MMAAPPRVDLEPKFKDVPESFETKKELTVETPRKLREGSGAVVVRANALLLPSAKEPTTTTTRYSHYMSE